MVDRNRAITFGTQIRTLFDIGALGSMPDGALLDHFGRGGEASEAAFATLVERHGPLVLRVCRRLLADGHLAEDAFQVTFLLLARRARSIRDPDALAGWLFRVARRVAARASTGNRRRQERERPSVAEIAAGVDNRVERDELCAVVHEEIDRLGNAQRLPILLCALEGLSHEEAAERLRWPVGTVKSRLVRGRRRLEGRLRGAAWPPHGAGSRRCRDSGRGRGLGNNDACTAGARGGHDAGCPTIRGRHRNPRRFGLAGCFRFHRPAPSKGVERHVPRQGQARRRRGHGRRRSRRFDRDDAGRRARPGRPGDRATIPPATTPTAKTPVAPTSEITRVPETDRGLPENPSVIPGQQKSDLIVAAADGHPSAFGQEVERAIRDGVRFLKSQQRDNGSWSDIENDAKTGVTSLVALALLAAGEKPDSPGISKAIAYLRGFGPNDLNSTYAISLQTQVFAAAEPNRDQFADRGQRELA